MSSRICQISKISEYNPLDLFSGSLERVNKAMKDLILTPQNNLRVFLNGSLIFGGSGGVADSTSCLNEELLEDALKCVILAEDGMRTTNFLHLVAEAVSRPGLLDRLLEVQKLDRLDIEGAIHAYYNVISQPCPVCRVFMEDKKKLSERYISLHSDPLSKSLKIVKDYLIAATAKDLSIMISFRPTEKRVKGSLNEFFTLKSNSQCFEYKVCSVQQICYHILMHLASNKQNWGGGGRWMFHSMRDFSYFLLQHLNYGLRLVLLMTITVK